MVIFASVCGLLDANTSDRELLAGLIGRDFAFQAILNSPAKNTGKANNLKVAAAKKVCTIKNPFFSCL